MNVPEYIELNLEPYRWPLNSGLMVLGVRGLIDRDGDATAVSSKIDKNIRKSFGDRIRSLRRDAGMSQEALAAEAALDRSYIGGVERGERNVSLINIHKIAKALGVTPDVLFLKGTLDGAP